MEILLAFVLSILATFLILLVLVQRGRGGGLTGALGGAGGSSAFGAKAGDVFTRITIGVAAGWIILCVLAAYWAGHRADLLGGGATGPDDLTGPALSMPADAEGQAADGPTGGGRDEAVVDDAASSGGAATPDTDALSPGPPSDATSAADEASGDDPAN